MELWSHQVRVESHALTPTSLARIQVVFTGFDAPGMEEETRPTHLRRTSAHTFATAVDGAFSRDAELEGSKHADTIGGVLSLPLSASLRAMEARREIRGGCK